MNNRDLIIKHLKEVIKSLETSIIKEVSPDKDSAYYPSYYETQQSIVEYVSDKHRFETALYWVERVKEL